MSSYSWDLQRAVYFELIAASISGVSEIVDHKIEDPQPSDFPYVQIGNVSSVQDDVACFDGTEETFDIHSWSRTNGQKEVKQIMGGVHGALHNKHLTVSGLGSVHSFVSGERILDDPDGKTRHGVTTVTIYCRGA